MERYASVYIRGKNESEKVKLASSLKPEIQDHIVDKWQSLIDTAARLAQVPAGLIMRLHEKTIEVFLKSNTAGNPYKKGEEVELGCGLYCETVIGSQQKLLVPDARSSEVWARNNPDVDIDMVSYLGFPVNWPDGEIFGTVCWLDNKKNYFNQDYEDLLHQIKQHLEGDLENIILSNDLEEKNIQLDHLNNTKSKFLSLISHDIRGSIAANSEFLKMIVNDFDQYDSPELKSILNALSESVASSYETMESLLGWSKNDILQIRPDSKIIDIIDIIEKQLCLFEQQIKMKNIRVVKSYDITRAMVNTDENMLKVVLRNLISNAIKYNNKNGELMIKVVSRGENFVVLIKDTGIGMRKETLDGIFKYNEKALPGTFGESSAGIGLILVKEFLDKIGAQISIDSNPGKGSSFSITIKHGVV